MVRDSQQKWREVHPHYQKNYCQTRPEAAARNRQLQHQRDQKRRVCLLVKNTLVLDLIDRGASFEVFKDGGHRQPGLRTSPLWFRMADLRVVEFSAWSRLSVAYSWEALAF